MDGCAQRHAVVGGHAAEVVTVVRQLVPLLTGNFAGFATDADGGVRELRRSHSIFAVSAFDS